VRATPGRNRRDQVSAVMTAKQYIGAVAAALIVAATSAALASTGTETITKIIEYLNFIGEFNEKAGKVSEGVDLLFRMGPEVDQHLEELVRRSDSFHPKSYVQEPKLDGDTVFSPDPAKRQAIREEWATFLQDEINEIDRLKKRRKAQQADKDKHQAQLDTVGKIRDLLEEISKNPQWGLSQYEAAKKWVDLDAMETKLTGIVGDYKRILQEYDALIELKQTEHASHVFVGQFLEKVATLPTPPSVEQVGSPPIGQQQPPPSVRHDGGEGTRSLVEDRIGAAVDQKGAWLIYEAGKRKAYLEQQRQEINRIVRQLAGSNSAPAAAEPRGRREQRRSDHRRFRRCIPTAVAWAQVGPQVRS
jgi:hypothetical protein